MNLLFFQNCISPHQIPYIRECARDSRVDKTVLIVPRVDYEQRKSMGWNSGNLLVDTSIVCRVLPSDEYVSDVFKYHEDSCCLFSGIRADSEVFRWFKMSLPYNVKRYIITEPPFTYKKPLWMHYVRFFLQDYKYVKYINGIFGFGQDAVNYYNSISKRWKVFPFLYVTESTQRLSEALPSGKLKLIFAGSLSPRKNLKVVLKALEGLEDIELSVIGDGEERNMLEDFAGRNHLPVAFWGKRRMDEIPSIMEQHDILILPSLHDGWGAVVNEAITLGLYVIVSEKCGAKALITDDDIGIVFKNDDRHDLHEKLSLCINNKEQIRKGLEHRLEYSKSIQGPAVAKYFINSLLNV